MIKIRLYTEDRNDARQIEDHEDNGPQVTMESDSDGGPWNRTIEQTRDLDDDGGLWNRTIEQTRESDDDGGLWNRTIEQTRESDDDGGLWNRTIEQTNKQTANDGGGDWLPMHKVEESDDRIRVVVVGNGKDHASGVVDVLTTGFDYEEHSTSAGLRILYSSEAAPGRLFLSTTPLQHVFDKSVVAEAKRWISQNSLRRAIVGRSTIVICVIPYTALEDECYSSVADHRHCWLDALSLVFREYKRGVIFLVNDCPTNPSHFSIEVLKAVVKSHHFDSRNIIFCKSDDDLRARVEESVAWTLADNAKDFKGQFIGRPLQAVRGLMREVLPMGLDKVANLKPFTVKEVHSSQRKYEIWGSDRILLFGRTGSGKSTLAQMLTTGKLDPFSKVFTVGAGLRGCTSEIERGQGRGWYVLDTPGFGEPNSEKSTMTNQQVCETIKEFIAVLEGAFTHYIYVLAKGRVDELDAQLWRFFKLLFGDELSTHFSIVVTSADSVWLEENLKHLEKQFDGCKSFFCVDFPPQDLDEYEIAVVEPQLEAESQDVRRSSLLELEEQLDALRRCDRACFYGRNSRITNVMERDRCNMDKKIDRSVVVKAGVRVSEAMADLDKFVSRLVHTLTINNKVAMLPISLP